MFRLWLTTNTLYVIQLSDRVLQIHVNIQFVINNFDKHSDPCNRLRDSAPSTVVYLTQIYNLTTNTYMYVPFVVNNEYIICYSAIRQGIYMVFIWLMSNEDNFIINQLTNRTYMYVFVVNHK
jgi:hypothetical protein